MSHDVGSGHLLLALLNTALPNGTPCTAAALLRRHGVSLLRTEALLSACTDTETDSPRDPIPEKGLPPMTPTLRRICRESESEAHRFPVSFSGPSSARPEIGTEHLLLALLTENDCVSSHLLAAQNVRQNDLYGELLAYLTSVSAQSGDIKGKESNPLADFTHDLTADAENADPVAGRDAETERILQILLRRRKNNPVLLGDPGVGKTAVVEGLAQRIAEGCVPEALRGMRLLSLDLSAVVAGTKYRGEFEERMRRILSACEEQPDTILFLDEIHTVMGAGNAEGALDCANLLKPALARGTIRIIGATTQEEYRKTVARDGAMERRFQPILIEEPSAEVSFSILSALRPRYETHHGVTIPDETLRAAVLLSIRYLPERRLPDKAIDLIDEACSEVRLAMSGNRDVNPLEHAVLSGRLSEAKRNPAIWSSRRKRKVSPPSVLPKDAAAVVTRWTGIPLPEQAGQPPDLSVIEETLRRRVIGQEEAVAAAAGAVRRFFSGISDPHRPSASFLFAGPTGVGKTELCRALSEALFGTEDRMLRLDMTEYAEAHTVSRLLGAPPGYVGFEEEGQLTGPVRRRPYSVICFDELEKAHPAVIRLLLQLLEDGQLTDSRGIRVSFRSAVIVMTTNAGFEGRTRPLGFLSSADTKEDALSSVFPPEFLNRIDAVIPFHPLSEVALCDITRRFLSLTAERAAEQRIILSYADDLTDYFIKKHADENGGARPIRRAITKELETPLADRILAGEFRCGSTVRVFPRNGEICFSVLPE